MRRMIPSDVREARHLLKQAKQMLAQSGLDEALAALDQTMAAIDEGADDMGNAKERPDDVQVGARAKAADQGEKEPQDDGESSGDPMGDAKQRLMKALEAA